MGGLFNTENIVGADSSAENLFTEYRRDIVRFVVFDILPKTLCFSTRNMNSLIGPKM